MLSFTKKQQIVILIVSIILITIFTFLSRKDNREQYDKDIKDSFSEDTLVVEDNLEEVEDKEDMKQVVVYIKGAVKSPGIVSIESGKRVIDVIELSGGLASTADIENVNIARKVQDEEMIHIPHIGEDLSGNYNQDDSGSSQVASPTDNKMVNINSASKEELTTLSGIGDATAEKIIQHRENSRFSKIEDIMDVSGIGEKKFESIKENISVN